MLKDVFHLSFNYVRRQLNSQESNASSNTTKSSFSQKTSSQQQQQKTKRTYFQQQPNLTSENSSHMHSQSKFQQVKEEILYDQIVYEYSFNILTDMMQMRDPLTINKDELLKEARKSLYFWKNNPENNEKHLRQQINLPTRQDDSEKRSLLGIQNQHEWIENFNIGSIMHMIPVGYDDFCFFGDLIYELSKKKILEKVTRPIPHSFAA